MPTTYVPQKFDVPNSLDEQGLNLGLTRLTDETLAVYQRRLILEARDPSGASERDFIRSLNRKVGEFDEAVFEIGLLLDGNGDPLAVDPYIEVTSTYLRAYEDYANSTLDFELNLVDRGDAYFLREVVTAFGTSTFFGLTVLDATHTFKKSDHLRYDDTERIVLGEGLRSSKNNKLKHRFVRNVYAQATDVFQTEEVTPGAVTDVGDFYVDYDEGVVITNETARGFISYTYREFPWTMYWQTVRPMPYNDVDKIYRFQNDIVNDDTGLESPGALNSEGARIANQVIQVHPLGWGK